MMTMTGVCMARVALQLMGPVVTMTDVWLIELLLALRNPTARIAQPTRLWVARLPVRTRAVRWTWLLGSNFLGIPVLNRNQSIIPPLMPPPHAGRRAY